MAKRGASRLDDGQRPPLLERVHEPVECVESELHPQDEKRTYVRLATLGSVREQRHRQALVAAEQHGAGDRGRSEARRAPRRARRRARRCRDASNGSASWTRGRRRGCRRDADEREPLALDQRQRGREQLPRGDEDRLRSARSRAAACATGSRARSRRSAAAGRRCGRRRPAARIRRVTRSTSADERRRRSSSGDVGARPSARCEPIERAAPADLHRPRIAVVGERVEVAARARGRASRRARLGEPRRPRRRSRCPRVVQLAARSPARRPRAARPGAGGGRRARRPAARRAGRRAWPRRSPPWPGTWSARRRP